MAQDRLPADTDFEWLDHVQPVGLVFARGLLKSLTLSPERQTKLDDEVVATFIDSTPDKPALKDPWAFFNAILGWQPGSVAGTPGGPSLPGDLTVSLPDYDTSLSPTWAVRGVRGEAPWQLLVRCEAPGIDPDKRGSLSGWEATPHQRFERLLQEAQVPIGVLVTDAELRLVYRPKGESSGWLGFPLKALGTVAGRPMLGGLKLALGSFRLFNDSPERRLPALLKNSREAQAAVSSNLSAQVLGALHDLLRGLQAADPKLIGALPGNNPQHLYEGLLTVLMRLVFILYAEERDLIPSMTDARARALYAQGYSVRGLYAKVAEDEARYPDTMDERVGAWGWLLALFRLVHRGHPSGWIKGRGGKLFDPDAFPFLEGRCAAPETPQDPPRVLPVSDGTILRILRGLMVVDGERISYRTLDVNEIGSVYETVMGFTVETAVGRALAIRAGKNNRTPVFVDLDALAAAKGKDRLKFLKEEANRGQLSASVAKAVEQARTADDLAAALDATVDERGSPMRRAVPAGTPILQPTDERRRTGSHYTPRSLTEPIVRHALEPAFERVGPGATPDEVLALKVCDPAMGSGAFLVEACRALAARLVAAWEKHKDRKPAIPPDEDEDLHARRLVAQRCLYGVDKNPLATDLARLSLWLATLARDHEFTFLDHALKTGDSLVGLSLEQIEAVNWDTSKKALPLLHGLILGKVKEVVAGRSQIQQAPDDVTRAIQESRHRIVEKEIEQPRTYADAIVAAFFSADKRAAREQQRQVVESLIAGGSRAESYKKLRDIASSLKQGEHPLRPFHWQIEFPEVFARDNGGFDAIVGNPPYLGGTKISGAYSPRYFHWIAENVMADGDKADLIAYFIRRVFHILRPKGATGLVTTSSIAEGDTRKSALVWLRQHEGQIYRAFKKDAWPGEANIDISRIHIAKGISITPCMLEGEPVAEINSFLTSGSLDYEPFSLGANLEKCFEGFVPYGEGFVIDDRSDGATSLAEIADIVRKEPQSAEVIYPFLGGEEVTEDPTLAPTRQVIYLAQMPELEVKTKYPAIYGLLERKVRPYRMSKSPRVARAPWWQFLWSRPALNRKMRSLDMMIVISRLSKHHAFARISTQLIPSTRLSVITLPGFAQYAAIQSSAHELWTRYFGATRGMRSNYSPADCFETFPFPPGFETDPRLEAAGQAYHDHRAALMVARNEGMTKTYNRFHDPRETAADIVTLRELHAAMDRAVLAAYGWGDLAGRAAPIFLDETNEDDHTYQGRLFWPSPFRDELLSRLLALNAERHAEEVRLGIAPGMRGKAAEDEEESEA
jgi:hypothetical protein